MQKKIVIIFKTDGTSKVEAFGYAGVGCEAATEPFEKVLGKVIKRDKKEPDVVQEELESVRNG